MNTITKTEQVLLDMFTENTGIHGMDSGGAYGRHWQGWQGMTLEAALAMPEGTHHLDKQTPEFSYFTISCFHYLRKNLTVTEETENLTKRFREFVEATPEGEGYYNSGSTLEDFLAVEFPGVEFIGDNTYNYDNYLDQNFLSYFSASRNDKETFEPKLVALSIHGGADIRGGYTDFVFFQAEHTYWANGIGDVELECLKCLEGGSIYSMVDEYWAGLDNPFFNLQKGCPNCQGELTVFTEKVEV